MQQFKVLLFSLIAVPLSALGSVNHSVSSAKKNHEYYVRANLGLPFYRKAKKSFGDSIRFMPDGNVAVGMRYQKFGADIEGGYAYFKTRSTIPGGFQTKSSLNSKTLFLNLFFYPTLFQNKIRPYIGAGVGAAFNQKGNKYSYFNNTKVLASKGLKTHDTALQGIVGGEYMINNEFAVLADFRYIYLGKFKQSNAIGFTNYAKLFPLGTFTVGAKYKF
jgi:opacity protein-like surface antigen